MVDDDSGEGDSRTLTIVSSNSNEAPVVEVQSFSIAEDAANGTLVGAVTASDPDAGGGTNLD